MIAVVIAFIAAAALLVWLVHSFGIVGFAVFAGLAIVAWLVFTWYHADDEPVFGPASQKRITFKAVVANAFRDVVELTRPVWLRAWINAPTLAVAGLDVFAAIDPVMREAVLSSPTGIGIVLALNLLARLGSTGAPAVPR